MLSDILKGKPYDPERAAAALAEIAGEFVYPHSITVQDGVAFFLTRSEVERSKNLLVAATPGTDLAAFSGQEASLEAQGLILKRCPTDSVNARALQERLAFLRPQVVGLRKSFGCGDRLGLATPGHVRALRGSGLFPIFPQQSIREMTRTQRTPERVMTDAVWGVFQEGYRDGFGSDADHLKTTEDIDHCLAAGFTMFTIDPGDQVDDTADDCPADVAAEKLNALNWDELETTREESWARYVEKSFSVGESTIELDHETLMRAGVKYGAAVAHTAKLYRHLVEKATGPFELEVSVDEARLPTRVAEHFLIASELRRLGVKWVSLAPRFIGEFEKGIDYKGDLEAFEHLFAQHVAVARHFGGYKLSLHSGSDKFSVYPLAAGHAGDLIHVKTAGTSYLEALRALAAVDPGLFREILDFAFTRYETDKASYHVSADPDVVPHSKDLKDSQLAAVLDTNDGRQLLHITYGSVLTAGDENDSPRFRDRLLEALREHEEEHYGALEQHFRRHVAPFMKREGEK